MKAEVSEADTEATNVSKLIAITKKYTRIDELTPEILNTFVDKIVVHECGKWNGNTENVPNVKPPKYRRGRRKSALLPIHIYFYPYLVSIKTHPYKKYVFSIPFPAFFHKLCSFGTYYLPKEESAMNHTTPKESVLELPNSCRAAADRMEAALREEDQASYSTAHLNGTAYSIVKDAEKALSQELGRDIVLAAYQKNE